MVSIESLHGRNPKPEVVRNKEYSLNENGRTLFHNGFGLDLEVGDTLKIIRRFKGGQYIGVINGTEVAFLENEDLFEPKT